MVGIRVPFGKPYLQVQTVSFRECNSLVRLNRCSTGLLNCCFRWFLSRLQGGLQGRRVMSQMKNISNNTNDSQYVRIMVGNSLGSYKRLLLQYFKFRYYSIINHSETPYIYIYYNTIIPLTSSSQTSRCFITTSILPPNQHQSKLPIKEGIQFIALGQFVGSSDSTPQRHFHPAVFVFLPSTQLRVFQGKRLFFQEIKDHQKCSSSSVVLFIIYCLYSVCVYINYILHNIHIMYLYLFTSVIKKKH